jgi:hypothetical protein
MEFNMKKISIIAILVLCSSYIYAQNYYVPELIYFRMHNNSTTTTVNFASSPVGTNPAPYSGGVMTSGGEFDTCIQGTGNSGSNGIFPNWNCSLGSGNWTVSFWIKDLAEVVAGNPVYLLGDPGSSSLRCFYGGYALLNNCIFRGPFTDVTLPCPMPGNYVFHIVYDGSNLIVYRNGTLVSTTPAAFTLPTGTGFRVAGYTGGTNSLNSTGKMDEFRLYNRALGQTEITNTWNHELPIIVGISGNSNEIPVKYVLFQNYPNPFNPNTIISYGIPKASHVNLTVIDFLGRTVATLVNEYKQAGNYEYYFDGSNFASGVYIYKIESNDFTDVKKMILLK